MRDTSQNTSTSKKQRQFDVYGWLTLTSRGFWKLKGKKLENQKLIELINNNYLKDEFGRYFFQNGNQRVFVSLELAPFVINIAQNNPLILVTHTKIVIENIDQVWLDSNMNLMLQFGEIIGSLNDRDTLDLSNYLTNSSGHSMDSPEFFKESKNHSTVTFEDLFLEYRNKRTKIITFTKKQRAPQLTYINIPKPIRQK